MAGLVENAQNTEAGVAVPESHRTVLSTSIDILDENQNNIGYIQSINESENRPVAPVRHLNSGDAGRILEMAPSPSTTTLSVNGFALYNKQNDGSIIQRLGAASTAKAMKMLSEQKIPFDLVETTTHPATGEVVDTTVYHQCWWTSKSKPVNIGTVTIQESGNISVTWVD